MRWLTSRVNRFWRWALQLPRYLSLPVGVVLVGAIGFGVYQGVEFWNYMQHDPDFCQSCHVMGDSWDRWATSEHSSIGCHDCHHQSLMASASQLVNFVFNNPDEITKHAEVEDKYCMDCHESGDPQWLQVAATSGHRLHNDELGIECVTCHSTSIHRFTPATDVCQDCHDNHVQSSTMASMHCQACHDFLAPGDEPLPTRAACLDCHESLAANVVFPADAPMQFDCGTCHQPHREDITVADCSSCHETGGLHTLVSHQATDCEACHTPHDWRISDRSTCLTCHPGQAEHMGTANCQTCHQFAEN